MAIYFTKIIPRKAIWGGKLLGTYFGYEQLAGKYGQCWAFSAQKKASNEILNGIYKGLTLDNLWEDHPETFCSRFQTFPFIISLVAPEQDLSVQVHPPYEIAQKTC